MALKDNKANKKLLTRLKSRYRLVLVNDVTFDERFSAFLTPLNVLAIVAFLFFVTAALVVGIIVFTPIKEYIPGYSDTQTRTKALRAASRADSLANVQRLYIQYFDNLSRVLAGDILPDSVDAQSSTGDKRITYQSLNFAVSREDSLLRREIESEDRFALNPGVELSTAALGLPGVFFFTPLRGMLTSSFNPSIGHFGVDIAADEGEPVSAVFDGTIVMASFTSDGGYVVQMQHPNNLVSVYKHNSSILKKVGDRVAAGDIIAFVGNTGDYTDGPHLHFELWYNGNALNPQEFIAFTQ